MSKQRKYTNDQLVEAVATSHSIRTVLEKIGLTPAGGNYETVKKHIQELNLDTSHFLGQAILRNKTHAYNTRPLDTILVHGKLENTWRLKSRLVREGLKENQCENCGKTKGWVYLFRLNSITKMVTEPTILYRTLSSCVLIVIH